MIELDFYAKKLLTFGSSWWFFYSFQNDRLERKKRSEILSENSAVVRVTNVLTKTLQAPGKFGLFLERCCSLCRVEHLLTITKSFVPNRGLIQKDDKKSDELKENACLMRSPLNRRLKRPRASEQRVAAIFHNWVQHYDPKANWIHCLQPLLEFFLTFWYLYLYNNPLKLELWVQSI